MYALMMARLAGVKRIYVTEHLAPDQRLPLPERALRSLVTRLVDGVVCVSQKNYEARAAHLYTPAARTLVVNNGVDLDDFPPISEEKRLHLREQYAIPSDALVIGTIVRFEPEKGLNYLFDAVPQFWHNQIHIFYEPHGFASRRTAPRLEAWFCRSRAIYRLPDDPRHISVC